MTKEDQDFMNSDRTCADRRSRGQAINLTSFQTRN